MNIKTIADVIEIMILGGGTVAGIRTPRKSGNHDTTKIHPLPTMPMLHTN
jgi:hypothetical protein